VKLCFNKIGFSFAVSKVSVNIESLSSGIYFLNIKFDHSTSVIKKFVKQ